MNKHLITAVNRIRRAPYQTLAATSIMTMTLFLGSVFFLLAAGSEAVLKYFETRPQVNAFFKENYIPTSVEVENITSQLTATGKTEAVKYVSKDDALSLYRELNKSDPLLLEAVSASMLPASIEVSAKNPQDLKSLSEQLKTFEGIEDVRFAEDIVASLTNWTRSIRVIGISLVGAHVFITFVIIMLIVGMKISSRRDEIGILSLVGATPRYIAAPFIWEGVIYGVVGAIMAWGTAYLILLYSMGFWVNFLAGIPILPPPILFMFAVLGGEILLGLLVGGASSTFAVRRFLKS